MQHPFAILVSSCLKNSYQQKFLHSTNKYKQAVVHNDVHKNPDLQVAGATDLIIDLFQNVEEHSKL
jgi:hypothetical protein